MSWQHILAASCDAGLTCFFLFLPYSTLPPFAYVFAFHFRFFQLKLRRGWLVIKCCVAGPQQGRSRRWSRGRSRRWSSPGKHLISNPSDASNLSLCFSPITGWKLCKCPVFGRTSTGVGQREGGVEAWHKAAKHALAGKLFFIAAFKICSSSHLPWLQMALAV